MRRACWFTWSRRARLSRASASTNGWVSAVSGAVLPALGLYADGYYFWDPLHAIAAKALLALLLVHVVAHWRWLAGFFKNGKGERHGK